MAQFWNPSLMSLKLKIQDQLEILNKSCLKKENNIGKNGLGI